MSSSTNTIVSTDKSLARIRAVTAFVSLSYEDFRVTSSATAASLEGDYMNGAAYTKIYNAKQTLSTVEGALKAAGYEVQTFRVATNPFGEYLTSPPSSPSLALQGEVLKLQLSELNSILENLNIDFFAIGPAKTIEEIDLCPTIVSMSHRFSCSAAMNSGNDVLNAKKAAECMKIISQLGATVQGDHVKDGLGNFRFCVTACCKPYTPFFPAAMGPPLSKSSSSIQVVPFSIGLENGKLAKVLLERSVTADKISTFFRDEMANYLKPIQTICESICVEGESSSEFMGMDTSLNPSLDANGSVVEAIENIHTVQKFGGPGSISAAAEITQSLKTLPGIKTVGYCGLMLPVCEDRRLALLASARDIDTTRLLAISSVCGVGLDTVPVPDCDVENLTSLILDVASLSFRYGKSLSCRLLICPGSKEGDMTNFNSPYMCECKIFNV